MGVKGFLAYCTGIGETPPDYSRDEFLLQGSADITLERREVLNAAVDLGIDVSPHVVDTHAALVSTVDPGSPHASVTEGNVACGNGGRIVDLRQAARSLDTTDGLAVSDSGLREGYSVTLCSTEGGNDYSQGVGDELHARWLRLNAELRAKQEAIRLNQEEYESNRPTQARRDHLARRFGELSQEIADLERRMKVLDEQLRDMHDRGTWTPPPMWREAHPELFREPLPGYQASPPVKELPGYNSRPQGKEDFFIPGRRADPQGKQEPVGGGYQGDVERLGDLLGGTFETTPEAQSRARIMLIIGTIVMVVFFGVAGVACRMLRVRS